MVNDVADITENVAPEPGVMCRFLKCHNNSFQAALVYICEVASKCVDARKQGDERECAI
jgi:hypothetical protein